MGFLTTIAQLAAAILISNGPSPTPTSSPTHGLDVGYVVEKEARGADAERLLAAELVAAVEDGFSLVDVVTADGEEPGLELHFTGPEEMVFAVFTDSQGRVLSLEVQATTQPEAVDRGAVIELSDDVISPLSNKPRVRSLALDEHGSLVLNLGSEKVLLPALVGC